MFYNTFFTDKIKHKKYWAPAADCKKKSFRLKIGFQFSPAKAVSIHICRKTTVPNWLHLSLYKEAPSDVLTLLNTLDLLLTIASPGNNLFAISKSIAREPLMDLRNCLTLSGDLTVQLSSDFTSCSIIHSLNIEISHLHQQQTHISNNSMSTSYWLSILLTLSLTISKIRKTWTLKQ